MTTVVPLPGNGLAKSFFLNLRSNVSNHAAVAI